MEIIIGGRGAGKTIALLEWVLEGNKVPYYPGWDRIILTSTVEESMRLQRLLRESVLRVDGHHDPDGAHRIYSYHEYQQGRFPNAPVEYMIDDLEFLLQELLRRSSPPTHELRGFTITGHAKRLGQDEV